MQLMGQHQRTFLRDETRLFPHLCQKLLVTTHASKSSSHSVFLQCQNREKIGKIVTPESKLVDFRIAR
jgi:hypothetical protein